GRRDPAGAPPLHRMIRASRGSAASFCFNPHANEFKPWAMLHFAYGSNMDRDAMGRRCPGAVAIGVAALDGWRFIVTRDGYASVVPARGETVHGVLWRLGPCHLATLNAYESLDSGLYRRRILAVSRGGGRVQALVYVARGRCPGRPRPGYQDLVIAAA